jgi:hypothetical protein
MSVATTTHYGLKKPDGSEAIKPDAFNDNAEVIDNQMYKNSVLTGTSTPTTSTVGAVGQFYIDTAGSILYQCFTVSGNTYTWNKISVSIYTGTTEPSSSTGANGDFYFKTK